jgi:hypothetical protein
LSRGFVAEVLSLIFDDLTTFIIDT